MGRILKFLVTAVGVPLIAHGIQSRSQPDKLGTIAFLTTHRKDIMHVGIVGLCSGIFLITGLSFTVFSIALRHDLNIPDVMTAGMVTSLSILAIGLILGLITWRLADELLDRYEEEEVTNEPLSLGRAILNSVLNSFMGTSAVPHNHRDNNYMPDRNMLN